ncbi:MAG TPA: AAA family ATPase [Sandaracinaceae bacterium LLY-WYZ-13_1]|nr:AAA family ATPase [Sandaracinaceae bacterium LLY-WYZ-13_1]
MKDEVLRLRRVDVRNFRCIDHVSFTTDGYTLLIGRNNTGKTSVVDALRCFYGDLKFDGQRDTRRGGGDDASVAVEVEFTRSAGEASNDSITIRRDFTANEITLREGADGPRSLKAKALSSGEYGRVVHVPAVTRLEDQTKTGGPSPVRELIADVVSSLQTEEKKEQLRRLTAQMEEALRNDGLEEAEGALNERLVGWRGDLRFRVDPPPIDKFVMAGVGLRFVVDGQDRQIEEFGSGFQRQLIASLLQVRAELENGAGSRNGGPIVLLFEEPEIFQHPAKQRQLARMLRQLADKAGWAVISSTHSPHFVERGADRLEALVRLTRRRGAAGAVSYQATKLLEALERCRQRGTEILGRGSGLSDAVALELDRARYDVDIDTERAGMFFADLVILAEGATEYAVFHRLIDTGVLELPTQSAEVVQTFGKYNTVRFLRMLDAFGVPTVVVHDRDATKTKEKDRLEHEALNQFIADECANCELASDPIVLDDDLETFLGWPTVTAKHLKPASALRHLEWVQIGSYPLTQPPGLVEEPWFGAALGRG